MTISEAANKSDEVVAEPPAPHRLLPSLSSPVSIGIGIVMLAAMVLVIRAYLPRWLFGNAGTLNWMWPVAVFAGYTLLGLVILTCVRWIDAMLRRYPDWSMLRRILAGSMLVVASTGIIVHGIIPPMFRLLVGGNPNLFAMWTISSVLGVTGYACFLMHRASVEQRERTFRLQLEADTLSTTLARAELSMLEAQIEPHFLFNTLAHIKRQYRIDAGTADHMLAALIDYLDRALPALQREDWTVGDELDLVQVYMGILKQRFGTRFQFTITVPDTSRTVRLPALTVATLVENAVRHGLAPKPEGGCVSITVDINNGAPLIEVCDNGAGLRRASGSGLGLATVRARLHAAFGNGAVLLVEPNQEAGVRASIRLPVSA